ncbi:BTB/POZ and MATH domain-containing protein 1-like [Oryza glaberrima]|uniref:BTB/POZ and MATH domain-containing protein 1-like n=1 Tax=Oryza glaberrima TaxID=4538 RepID=UPI00224C2CFC|nr:BTB/POZ and MATH domain-containing protein 1-like [Oryza glaberrima]
MSSSAAGNSSRSASTSTIVADTATGYHLLKIDGYSRTKGTPIGTAIASSQFVVGGHRWRIYYYPNGDHTDNADYMSFYLLLDEKKNTKTKSVKVRTLFQICFADQFIKREDFEKSKDLRDDSFTIRCDIAIVREFLVETTEVLPPKSFVSVPPSDMNLQLGELLETEKGADVVFEVAGERFAAHRCVLAARSPVLGAELYGLMKEGNAAVVVRVEDMEARVFKLLLRFVYTDSLPEMKKTDEAVMCQHLLVAADRYNLERLKLICEEKLCNHISTGTVSNMLLLADQHRCAGLQKACCNFLGSSANLSPVSRGCLSVMKVLVSGCWCLH